jgi:hypothetical protein
MESLTHPPNNQSKDEEHLRLLAIFHYLVAALGAAFACLPLIHVAIGVMMIASPDFMTGAQNEPFPTTAFAYIFVIMGGVFVILGWSAAICTFISGRLLAQRRKRMFSLVLGAFCASFSHLERCSGFSR